MRQLLEAIEKTNQRHHLFQKGDGVVIGLSGGPDSTALLLLLLSYQRKYGLRLFAAHLNHNLLPGEARQSELFSEKLTGRLNVPFFRKKINLKKIAAKNKKTLEEMGRIERYRFFNTIAAKVGAQKIATAHTLDDQAETILMRTARGAGLKGLSGIPVKRNEGGFQVIRPLLNISKKDIVQFLKKSGEAFRSDSSNKKDIFTHNRVRNTLIPWMENHLNPQIKQSLSGLGKICEEAQNLTESLAKKALKNCLLKRSAANVILDVSKLQRLHPAVRSEALFQALAMLKGDRLRFGAHHIEAIRAILESSENRLETHLPGAVTAVKEKGRLRIFDSFSK